MEVHDRKDPVQTHPLHISQGRDSVLEIRDELFSFPEVLDVFVTGRPDVLAVVCSGRPRPAQWLGALRAAGYETLPRRHASTNPCQTTKPNSDRNGSDGCTVRLIDRLLPRPTASGVHRADAELHRRRAEAEAEIEAHDIDDMLHAIAARRRRAGRREVGEELADELLRATWDDAA